MQEITAATTGHESSEITTALESESENPHEHATVWSAAAALEEHEDGSAPRIGVEYRKKSGNGTARKAGTVDKVIVERPDGQWTHNVERPTPRIVFVRDDGQNMYVEPDGLYTVGSHAPYLGSIVRITTSTTSTVDLPEAEQAQQEADDEQGSSGGSQASGHVQTPDLVARAQRQAEQAEGYTSVGREYVNALAEWAREDLGLHGTHGSEHYSWDIPGFDKRNDPHNGFTAKDGGDCVYAMLEGERTEAQERALAELAHRDGLEVSTRSTRVVLVPGQDLGQ